MSKKASLSLSTNAIVVLILAITMLGLALGFIKTMFGKTAAQVEALAANEPEPRPASPAEPFTLSRDTLVLSPSETIAIKFSSYKGATIQNPNLVGYWSFDDNTDDTSGKNNLGTRIGPLGTNLPQFVDGRYGKALRFDGVDDYVDAGSGSSLTIIGPLTVEAWINTNILSVDAGIAGRGINGNYQLTHHTNGFLYGYIGSGGNGLGSGNSIGINQWHHVVMTWDGTTNANGMKLYVDGGFKNQKVSTIASPPAGSSLKIGMASSYYNGMIDEVAIYNKALTPDQIKNTADGKILSLSGCISDTNTPSPTTPFKVVSQISKDVNSGQSVTSQAVIQALGSPVETVCQFCAEDFAGGGCIDVRVIIR